MAKVAPLLGTFLLPLTTAFGDLSSVNPPLHRAPAAIPSDVLATVGDRGITREELHRKIASLPPQMQTRYRSPQAQEELLQVMVEEELLYRAALKAGLEQDPAIAQQVATLQRRLMVKAYVDRYLQAEHLEEVPESAVVDYYQRHREEFTHKPSVVVRHILYSRREGAEQARERLQYEASFELLALQESANPTSGMRGGLLGTVVQGVGHPAISQTYDPKVDEVLFTLKPGEISQVVQTDLGYHLFKVLETLPARLQPLTEVRQFIQGKLRRQTRFERLHPHLQQLKVRLGYEAHEERIQGIPASPPPP